MKSLRHVPLCAAIALLFSVTSASATATAEEAARLKTTLTPLGAERAGNADGTIPAWTGGLTTVPAGYVNGARRPDPFSADKPLFSITAKNMDAHRSRLSDGVIAMLKKYPDTYRLDVYPTRRPMAAPQWVYDNTAANATRASLSPTGVPTGAYGGIPFPIPKTGEEVMHNHILRWRGEAWRFAIQGYVGLQDGRRVLTVDAVGDEQSPYYFKGGSPATHDGSMWHLRLVNSGPPIRAGEAITGKEHLDPDKTQVWTYLTGQRRVRKLPNACCDTPTPVSAGVMSFDELEVFTGRLDRFDWKLIGKKEIYIPMNNNRLIQATKVDAVLAPHHLAPDQVRWELHRVWVVEATLAAGKRHVAPKSRYYVDEDCWTAVLGDRWDANGQLWKTTFQLPIYAPDLPGYIGGPMGFYDLLSGAWFAMLDNAVGDAGNDHYRLMPRYPAAVFSPEAMAGDGR